MRTPRLIALALTSAGLLALSGCGGDGDEETTASKPAAEPAPTLSKAELISQGDAICGEVNAAVGSVGTTESDVQEQTIQVATLYTGMVERLNELGEPEDAAAYAEFAEAADEFGQVEGEVKLAAERADTVALGEAATRATPALEEFQSAAGAYGFESCSEGPTTSPVTGTAPGGVGAEEEEIAPEVTEEPELESEVEETPETETEEAPPEGGGTGPGSGAPSEGGGGESGGIGAG